MKVLVTGGTGFVGREVVRHLCGAGHSVRVLLRFGPRRSRRAHMRFSDHPVEVAEGDVLEGGSLSSPVQGMDAVVHLVGIISELGQSTFENVHVRGTQNMLHAAEAAGVKRFVHMSALGTRSSAVSRYHLTKWAAEEALRSSSLRWTIFRPSLIYGPGDQFVNLFARISRVSPVVPLLGRRDSLFEPIAVGAVATAFTRALTLPEAARQTYDLCSPEPLTLAQMLDSILEVLGRRRLKVQVPRAMASLQARILEWFYPVVLRRPPPLNTDQLTMLDEGNVGDGRAADRHFGLEHPPFKVGIGYLSGTPAEQGSR